MPLLLFDFDIFQKVHIKDDRNENMANLKTKKEEESQEAAAVHGHDPSRKCCKNHACVGSCVGV